MNGLPGSFPWSGRRHLFETHPPAGIPCLNERHGRIRARRHPNALPGSFAPFRQPVSQRLGSFAPSGHPTCTLLGLFAPSVRGSESRRVRSRRRQMGRVSLVRWSHSHRAEERPHAAIRQNWVRSSQNGNVPAAVLVALGSFALHFHPRRELHPGDRTVITNTSCIAIARLDSQHQRNNESNHSCMVQRTTATPSHAASKYQATMHRCDIVLRADRPAFPSSGLPRSANLN